MYHMPYYRIITNNPSVAARYPIADFHDVTAEGILIKCRDAVHSGCVLISHPITGGMRPGSCPYRSVVVTGDAGLSDANPVDIASLKMIEDAIVYANKSCGVNPHKPMDNGLLADYQAVDCDLTDCALRSIRHV